MDKCCCAVGCSNRFYKRCGLHFYRFPADIERRNHWVAAINRKNWKPTEYTWVCSCHFVGGHKSDNPTSPAYVPSLFDHIKSPAKRKAEHQLARYERTNVSKRRCILALCEEEAASSLSSLSTALIDNSTTELGNASVQETYSPLTHSCEQRTTCVLTDMTMESISKLELECATLREENLKLKSEIQNLRQDHFMNDPKSQKRIISVNA